MSIEYSLAYATHATPGQGRCAMEWVSYLAGEPHSDDPACVSPFPRAFCTTLNDSLEDLPRQRCGAPPDRDDVDLAQGVRSPLHGGPASAVRDCARSARRITDHRTRSNWPT